MAYSNSPLASVTILSPNCTRGRNHAIDTITIHCMAGNLSVESCGKWFSGSGARASSNYGVDSSGRIGLYVEEKDRSWCSSNSANDDRAVTIEVANTRASEPYPVSSAAYESLVDLLVDICNRNGIAKLVWSESKDDRVNHRRGCNMTVHRDFAAKSCPGQWLYERQGQIAEAVNSRLGGAQIERSAKAYAASKLFEVITKTDPLNVRHEPGSAGAILGVFARSEVVTGDSEATLADGSAWIRCTNGMITGWCSAAHLREVEPLPDPAPEDGGDAMSTADLLEQMSESQAAVITDMAQKYLRMLPESEWARGELDEAVELGITDGTYPKAFATREEVAIMMKRAVKAIVEGARYD